MDGAVYFVTWHLREGAEPLSPDERNIVESTLVHFNNQRYKLDAYVVMDSHVHVLVQLIGDFALEHVLNSWKSFTTNVLQKKFGRTGSVWLGEYYDRIVRDEKEFLEKLNYILTNPVRKWPEVTGYRWVYPKEQ